jgi:hypothetical protein
VSGWAFWGFGLEGWEGDFVIGDAAEKVDDQGIVAHSIQLARVKVRI